MAYAVSQIEWRCRRGMKELDLYFLPFYKNVFPLLSDKQQQDFEQLLDLDDLTLFECLFNQRVLADPFQQSIINLMQLFKQQSVAN